MASKEPKKKLPQEMVDKLISDYKSGMTLKQVCKENEVGIFYARYYLKDYIGVVDDSWKKEVVARYMSGETYVKLADDYGICINTVSDYLKLVGAVAERKRRLLETYEPVIEDYKKGLVERELVEKYPHFTKNNVHHIIDKYCPKRTVKVEEEDEYELIKKLPKAKEKARIRVTKEIVDKKVHTYHDIFDMVAGV